MQNGRPIWKGNCPFSSLNDHFDVSVRFGERPFTSRGPETPPTLDLVLVVKPIQDRPLWTLYKDCSRLCIAQSREKHPENDTQQK